MLSAREKDSTSKWISNDYKVLQSIPEEHKSKNLFELDLDRDKLPMKRALSLQQCIETDTFKFKLKVKEQPHTIIAHGQLCL